MTSLEKFRAHYPEGCLIADLVSMHDGQYVVRAAIVQKGETLATGLAASADVQIAEDKARERAIAALGIVPVHQTHGGAHSESANRESANRELANNSETIASKPEPVAPAQSAPLDADSATDAEAVPPIPPEEDLGPPIDAIEENSEAIAPAKPSAATLALESFNTSVNPVDLSDVIAQTDVELTRLGWTSAQGRDYLEKTYGKRSRQHLSDEELMSFLLYLEEQ
ncbi:MAG: hypothetical protein WBC73_09085 [Phormidesmis sp.]